MEDGHPTNEYYWNSIGCTEDNQAYRITGDKPVVTPPTATGKSFVGYYLTAGISEITKNNQSSGLNMVIDKDGKFKATSYITVDTQLYDVWARNCTTNPGANCSLSINSSGGVVYSTFCDKGAGIDRNGTYDPICKATFDQNGGSNGISERYVCNIGGVGTFCEKSDCTNCTTPGNKVSIPTRGTDYTFRGYYSTSGLIAQVINKDGKQVKDVNDFDTWKFEAQWVAYPCGKGYYYDKDSDNCYSCGSQEKGGETYSFTSIDGSHDKTKEEECYVDNDEDKFIYEDTIGRYILDDGSDGNCTLKLFDEN